MGSSKGVSGWADEEIELPSAPLGQERSSYDMRPGRAPPARGYGRDEAPLPVAIDHSALPRVPPFLAFVANLPYDVTEEDLRSFFSGISVVAMVFGSLLMRFRSRAFGFRVPATRVLVALDMWSFIRSRA